MQYDIVFISYDELCAEDNWLNLRRRFPKVKRVHGVDGILNAHKLAAQAVSGEWFFVVDGDNKIHSEFDFALPESQLCDDTTYVWRCINSVNGLCYGNGGVKLFNKRVFATVDEFWGDMTMSLSKRYKPVDVVASTTIINASAFHAWRAAFRESVKLSVPRKRVREEFIRQQRLGQWSNVKEDVEYAQWVARGCVEGIEFYRQCSATGEDHASFINNFNWLQQRFNEKYSEDQR
ncbi:hypothetical protein PNC201_12060 [Pseudoalteromonas sp. NC201]|nr:hypothetical protein PNC201_12060 [Pseudoalteromonas sp. NC201]QUI72804.1 hypothetical protein GSF13_18415 [Pseudoalteromonas sp. M8]